MLTSLHRWEANRSSCPRAPLCMQIVCIFILLHSVYDNSSLCISLSSLLFVVTCSSFLDKCKTKDVKQEEWYSAILLLGKQVYRFFFQNKLWEIWEAVEDIDLFDREDLFICQSEYTCLVCDEVDIYRWKFRWKWSFVRRNESKIWENRKCKNLFSNTEMFRLFLKYHLYRIVTGKQDKSYWNNAGKVLENFWRIKRHLFDFFEFRKKISKLG
jgi:hypothetical protein